MPHFCFIIFFSLHFLRIFEDCNLEIVLSMVNELHLKYTREIPAFGGISLALRGSGALGTTFGAPAVPISETAAEGGGERKKIKLGRHGRTIFGAPGAPRAGRQLS